METNVSKLTGIALATAVAGLFTLANATPAYANEGAEAKVKCEHSSSCKGQGACATAKNSCKGENACKGEGFTMQKDDAACKAAQETAKAKDAKK